MNSTNSFFKQGAYIVSIPWCICNLIHYAHQIDGRPSSTFPSQPIRAMSDKMWSCITNADLFTNNIWKKLKRRKKDAKNLSDAHVLIEWFSRWHQLWHCDWVGVKPIGMGNVGKRRRMGPISVDLKLDRLDNGPHFIIINGCNDSESRSFYSTRVIWHGSGPHRNSFA